MELTKTTEDLETMIKLSQDEQSIIKHYLYLYNAIENSKDEILNPSLKSELKKRSNGFLCPLFKDTLNQTCKLTSDENNIEIKDKTINIYCQESIIYKNSLRKNRLEKGPKEVSLHPIIELNLSKNR